MVGHAEKVKKDLSGSEQSTSVWFTVGDAVMYWKGHSQNLGLTGFSLLTM